MTSLPGQGERQLYIPMGFYKGNKVAIKTINIASINLTRPLMLELKTMKDLQHDHLVRFYGACVDGDPTCLLTEYCPKGSLQDILENEEIKLDWMFKLSLMHDIVKVLYYFNNSFMKRLFFNIRKWNSYISGHAFSTFNSYWITWLLEVFKLCRRLTFRT